MASERSLVLEPNMKPAEGKVAEVISLPNPNNPFLGTSTAIRQLENNSFKLLNSSSPVLIQGEPGTGKGFLARWLHENGPRAEELHVELQCVGISQSRIEAKLFGYEKGAFGSTQAKPGLLEIAQSGSVFLDEIAEMQLPVQKKLLRVLEENKFSRMGEAQDREADVRVIASSRCNLARRVQEGRFLKELYVRFGESLIAPPLRERVEDIPMLATHMLDRISTDQGTGMLHVSAMALQALQGFSWPGNIRELRNTLERAVLLSNGPSLSKEDLQFDLTVEASSLQLGSLKTLEEVERQYIQEVLWLEGGRVQAAAKKLGIPRSSLYHKLKQYGISRRDGHDMQWSQNAAGA
ncbi:MAG TPA: sigma-54 dependent transcriptional regulator [Terriglobales bacterium]|jgi:DNA-binding NtrC family response regulator